MRTIAITQRVAVAGGHGERRDCLDQAWARFLAACDLLPLALPNVSEVALALCSRADVVGLLLTGGNDLAALGGDAPERDATENAALDFASAHGMPVLGVCRGMQLIQHRAGIRLHRVEGHVARHQIAAINGEPTAINSFHCFGTTETRAPLEVWAVADDGVVKAIRDPGKPVTGIMWHPERMTPFAASDIALFRRLFGSA